MPKKNQKKKNNLLNILILVCCVVFLYSSYQLFNYYKEYKTNNKVYSDLNKIVIEETDLSLDDGGKLLRAPKINMSQLTQINSDVVGYIMIPDTKISYPILYHNDMTKYIDHDVYLNYSRSGAIFMDSNNNIDFNDDNTIIYGHQMKDGTMFGDLTKYFRSSDYVNQHRYIYLYLEDELRLYEIFAGRTTEATSDEYTTYFDDLNAKKAYINEQMSYSAFETIPDINIEDSIITLSTCTNITETSRYVVFAHLVTTKKLS